MVLKVKWRRDTHYLSCKIGETASLQPSEEKEKGRRKKKKEKKKAL
jgi:hypothetical protein